MLERWRPGAWCAARDVQAKGRLQPWNSKGWRPEGLVAAAAQRLTARGLGGSCREEAVQQLEGCKGFEAGTLTAASLVEAAARDVQEKGRLQTWNSKGWRPEGLVEAAARELEGFKGFKRLKPGKRQAWMP